MRTLIFISLFLIVVPSICFSQSDNLREIIEYEEVFPVEETEVPGSDGRPLYYTKFKLDAHYERGIGARRVLIIGKLIPQEGEYFSSENVIEFLGGLDSEYVLERTYSNYYEELVDSIKARDSSLMEGIFLIKAKFDPVVTLDYFIYVLDYNNVKPRLKDISIVYYFE
ncbi:MAG: hypothetical protein KDC73_04570 [Ignavibacteriae bacterium]|nr:hypothetical protein [Ignavibacteriota bacterium]MCB9244004.1 hypothetical protein [Ignavibacteriales bacterium]